MEKEQFLSILANYLEGKATAEEEDFLYAYYKLFLADADVLALLEGREKEKLKLAIKAHIDEHIDGQLGSATVKRLPLWPRIAAAASIIIFLSVGGYFLLHKKQAQVQLAQNQPQDIAPGQNRATLTLANGQKIILAKGLKGQLAVQGGTVIRANANDITYNAANKEEAVSYNTLATAKGEQSPYPLVLADGTKVWLNAASSITFPTAFTGKEREVKVTGEAYFEVAHNAAQPFRVNANGLTIEDIGTAFDINAYSDEPVIKTTLLEGSVRLRKAAHQVVLSPGQAGIVPIASDQLRVQRVNTEEAVAWRKGYFFFNEEDLQSVMRKIERWYNVQVVYPQSGPPKETFGGTATRYANVSQVLAALEKTSELRFRIEGRKIYVLK